VEDALADEVLDALDRLGWVVDGSCYAASEAYYLLAGGKSAGLTPVRGEVTSILHRSWGGSCHEGAYHAPSVHWWLKRDGGEVVDLTAAQFAEPFPYEVGRGRGFMPNPSRHSNLIVREVERGRDAAQPG
jgi:hypothetical protein